MKHSSATIRTLISLTAGFLLSLGLTVSAYLVAVGNIKDSVTAVGVLIVLAATQLVIQLVFFLHFGEERRPRWNMWSFVFMGIVLFIIVAGSIWIMYHLNYNMMTMSPDQKDTYMQTQGNKGF
jgi:cytochrome o ubiquinol oxidase operon protein cyoD